MIEPHCVGQGMIFAIAERSWTRAFEMGSKAEANGIVLDLDPDMAQGIACAPFKQDHGIHILQSVHVL